MFLSLSVPSYRKIRCLFEIHFRQNTTLTIIMSNELHAAELPSDLSFRPAKRRKFYRKRVDIDEGGDNPSLAPAGPTALTELLTVEELIAQNGQPSTSEAQVEEEPNLSVAEILRLRKAAQRRKGGIDFSNTSAITTIPPASDALAIKEDPIEQLKTVVDRFAPQTGQVADVDKHM